MLLNNSRKLLLKNQLHLNLNVNEEEEDTTIVDNNDDSKRYITRVGAAVKDIQKDGINVKTVTTVPQQHQQQIHFNIEATTLAITTTTTTPATITTKASTTVVTSLSSVSSSSLLDSSATTALAKFNRIIDSTVPVTNCYQHIYEQRMPQHQQLQLQQQLGQQQQQYVAPPLLSNTLQQRLALIYPDIVSNNSSHIKKINSTIAHERVKSRQQQPKIPVVKTSVLDKKLTLNDDNQMKRNDVHYLLKQLNSFSDIEEIEIVDMEQKQQQQQQQQQYAIDGVGIDIPSSSPLQLQSQPHPQSPHRLSSPSSLPPQPLHSPTATSLVITSPSSQSHKGIRRYASLHQQSDYASEKHYPLAAGHIDDNVIEQQQYLLQQFEDYIFQSCHYLETNYFAANYRTAMVESSSHEFRPSTTTGTSATSASSERSLDMQQDAEPPSVICNKKVPLPPTTKTITTKITPTTQSPTTTTTTAQHFQMQARLTSSGVQTELTAAAYSLTTAATNESLAKSSHSSSSSSEDHRRRKPFFKCCYTPIDRWRERRNAAAAVAATTSGTSQQRTDGSNINVSGVGRRRQQQQQQTHKNGHAV